MSDTTFNTFPFDKISALTMFYLEKQDLSSLSPEELLDKYDEIYGKLTAHYKEKRKNSRFSF